VHLIADGLYELCGVGCAVHEARQSEEEDGFLVGLGELVGKLADRLAVAVGASQIVGGPLEDQGELAEIGLAGFEEGLNEKSGLGDVEAGRVADRGEFGGVEEGFGESDGGGEGVWGCDVLQGEGDEPAAGEDFGDGGLRGGGESGGSLCDEGDHVR